MLIYHSNKTAGFPYEHFPYFGKRIKKLRHYMDSRKPKTLLDLARLKEPSGSILISTLARYDGTTGQIKSHACMLMYYDYQGWSSLDGGAVVEVSCNASKEGSPQSRRRCGNPSNIHSRDIPGASAQLRRIIRLN